ncbi:MAG: anti-anti-sigma factor, partial [Cyanobacteria bacterium J149]
LVRIAKQVENVKGKMQIVTNPRVTQTVKMVRLEKFLKLQNSLDEALKNV